MNVSVLSWRISSAIDSRGLMCYFDPYLEDISIRVLTAPERADRLDSMGKRERVERNETTLDLDYDPLHNELNNGS